MLEIDPRSRKENGSIWNNNLVNRSIWLVNSLSVRDLGSSV